MSLSTTFLSRFFPPVAADPTRGRDPYTAACKVSVVEAAASCGVGMLSETRVPEESRTTWWSSTINNRICTLACVGRERQLGVAEDTQAQRYRTPSGVLRTCNTVGKRLSAHQPGIPSGDFLSDKLKLCYLEFAQCGSAPCESHSTTPITSSN
jgi:hypothetical protein